MSQIDGGRPDGGAGLTVEELAWKIDGFPEPGEAYSGQDPYSIDRAVFDFERWAAECASSPGAGAANVDPAVIGFTGEYFASLLDETNGDPATRARLIRAAMILAEPDRLALRGSGEEGEKRFEETTLRAAEYALAQPGDPVILGAAHGSSGIRPSGVDSGRLRGPLSFSIVPRWSKGRGWGYTFRVDGIMDSPDGSSYFWAAIPKMIDDENDGGRPYIGWGQIEEAAARITSETRDLSSNARSRILRHAGLVCGLARVRDSGAGDSFNILEEYFGNEGVIRGYVALYGYCLDGSVMYPQLQGDAASIVRQAKGILEGLV